MSTTTYYGTLINISTQINEYLAAQKKNLASDDINVGHCGHHCAWLFLNPLVSGIGLTLYHCSKSILRLLDLASRIVSLAFGILAVIFTLRFHSFPDSVSGKWNDVLTSINVNVKTISQILFHALGTVSGIFSPTMGLELVQGAILIDIELDKILQDG